MLTKYSSFNIFKIKENKRLSINDIYTITFIKKK